MILARDLVKSFGNPPNQVIKSLNFQIETGEFVSIWGRSGSGKTTLLYLLSTLDNPSSGELLIDGVSPQKMSSRELHLFRNANLGFIFQFHYLLPELTALENVLLPPMKIQKQNEFKDRAMHLLESVGLKGKEQRFPGQLSGGEQQRVAIARSLIMKPKYIFADEPTGSLDSINGEKVMKLLIQAHQEYKTTVILVTHEKEFADLAPRKIFLLDGKISDQI